MKLWPRYNKEKSISLAVLLVFSVLFGTLAVLSPYSVLINTVLVSLLLCSVFKPSFGFLLTIIFVPMDNMRLIYYAPLRTDHYFYMPLAFFFIIATALGVLVQNVSNHEVEEKERKNTLVNMAALVFVGLSAISMGWTNDNSQAVHSIMLVIASVLLFKIVPRVVKTKKELMRIMVLLPVVGFLVAVQALLSDSYPNKSFELEILPDITFYYRLTATVTDGNARAGGVASPNFAANILIIFLVINFILCSVYKWRVRTVLAFHSLILVVAIMKTASKTGLLALLVGVFMLPVVVPQLRDKALRIMTAGFIVIGVFTVIFGRVILRRFEVMTTGEVDFFSQRIELWTLGFEKLIDTSGFGLGAGGFSMISLPPYPHSAYFSVLFDNGILAWISFLFLLAVMVFKHIKSLSGMKDRELSIAGHSLLIAVIIVLAHFLIDLHQIYLPFWLVVGMAFCVRDIQGARNREAGLC